ncbi:EF-hand domain-containing protein [Sphingomonas sp. M1A8_2b]
MLKYALLAGAMTIAVPALAQSTMTSPQTAPTATTGAADPSMSPAQTAPTSQAQAAPSQTAQTAQATQPASSAQVAQVVDSEFPTYDKNGDGKLSAAEFSGWMVALKTKTDPSTKPDAAETKTWVSAAFAQADADKNKSLTKSEVTSFLTQG